MYFRPLTRPNPIRGNTHGNELPFEGFGLRNHDHNGLFPLNRPIASAFTSLEEPDKRRKSAIIELKEKAGRKVVESNGRVATERRNGSVDLLGSETASFRKITALAA